MIQVQSTKLLVVGLALWLLGTSAAFAQQSERRIALVIGNASYQSAPLKTAANDAGLIAQTLQSAGFDVVGARDLDADSVRHAFRDFLDKAAASGPDTVAVVYVAGMGLQYEGENYLVPVDAKIERDTDVSVQAVRLSDYIRPLSALQLKARIVIIDAARDNPFARSGKPLASGLAMVDAEPGLVVAFNAAPGTIAPESTGPYGIYAQSLAEMIREGGLSPSEIFDRVRQRVNDVSGGAFIPWNVGRLDTPFVFFQLADNAPAATVTRRDFTERRGRAIRNFVAEDAYHEAIDRDTLQGYLDFVDAFPHHPQAKRVRVIIAARREAITWRRTFLADSPNGYWSYLDRYPTGPHAWDARRRLRRLAIEQDAPPLSFAAIDYDVPPPPREEIVFVERRVLFFSDSFFDFAPPPRPRVFFLPPPPPDFIILPPPPPSYEVYVLPVPFFVPVARWCEPPRYVAPPPPNLVYNNIHNAVVVNQTIINNNTVTNTTVNLVNPGIAGPTPPSSAVQTAPSLPGTSAPNAGTTSPAGVSKSVAIGAAASVGLAAAALTVALPPAVAKKQPLVATPNSGNPTPAAPGQPLMAPNGKTLPQPTARPVVPAPLVQTTTPQVGSAPIAAPPQGQTASPTPTQTITKAVPGAAGQPRSLPSVVPPGSLPQGKLLQGQAAPTPSAPSPQVPVSSGAKGSGQGLNSASKPDAVTTNGSNKKAPAAAATVLNPQQLSPAIEQATKPGVQPVEQKRQREQATQAAQRNLQQQRDQQAQEAQRGAQQQTAQQQQVQAEQQRQKQAAQDAQRRDQNAAQQRQQQQAAQDAQRRAQQQTAQDSQRRAQQQQVLAEQQRQKQAAQDAQRREQNAAQQRQQQQAAQEAQKRAQQQASQKKCGLPGTPTCPPN